MYIKRTKENDPYTIIISKEEMREAFRNPASHELFRAALMSQLIEVYFWEKEHDNGGMDDE